MAEITSTKHNLIGSDRVEGTVVRRPNGDKLGKIERLMIDKASGTIAYAVMSFGGLFGLGHSHYPIPWSLLKYNQTIGSYESDIPDEHLAKTETFNDLDFGDRSEELKVHERYGVPPYWGF